MKAQHSELSKSERRRLLEKQRQAKSARQAHHRRQKQLAELRRVGLVVSSGKNRGHMTYWADQ